MYMCIYRREVREWLMPKLFYTNDSNTLTLKSPAAVFSSLHEIDVIPSTPNE